MRTTLLFWMMVWILAPAGLAGAASVGPVTGIPGALKGDVSAKVSSCKSHPHSKHLLSARVTVTATGGHDIVVRGMECGAHNPRTGQVLFANPTDPLNRVPAGKSRSLDVVFPFDATHDQCRCRIRKVARVGASKKQEPKKEEKKKEEKKAEPEKKPEPEKKVEPEKKPEPERPIVVDPAPSLVPRPGGPRFEYVAVPEGALRGGPATASGLVAALEPGTRVTIEYEYAGWAFASVSSKGTSGWISTDELLPSQSEAVTAAEAVMERARARAEAKAAEEAKAEEPSAEPDADDGDAEDRAAQERAEAEAAGEAADASRAEAEAKALAEAVARAEAEAKAKAEAAALADADAKAKAEAEAKAAAEAAERARAEELASQPQGLCETVNLSEYSGMIDRIDGQRRSVYVSDLWYALPSGRKKGFVAYMNECYNLPTVRDSITNEELARYALTGISIFQ